jgi:hypothetical protein
VIDEVFADHYLDVVKAAALLRLPPTLTEGLARIPTEGPLARSSADPDVRGRACRAPITRFSVTSGGHPADQIADHIGGTVRFADIEAGSPTVTDL